MYEFKVMGSCIIVHFSTLALCCCDSGIMHTLSFSPVSSEAECCTELLLRVLYGFTACIIPIVGAAYYWLDPSFIDVLWARALVTLLAALGFASTFFELSKPLVRGALLVIVSALQFWLFGLAVLNGYAFDVVIYSLAAYVCISALLGYVYDSIRVPSAYLVYATTIGVLGYTLVESPELPLFVFLSSMAVYGMVVLAIMYITLYSKRQLLNQQQALIDQGQWLSDSQRIGQIGSWTYDPEARKLELSDEAQRIFGFEEDEPVTYRSFVQRLAPAALSSLRRVVTVVLYKDRPHVFRQRLCLPSGEKRWVEYTGQTVLVDGRKELRGTVRDITVLKAHEDELEAYQQHLEDLVRERTHELEQQKARYELINRVSTDLISINDAEGRYLFVSQSAPHITGYSAEELVGHNPFEFMTPEGIDCVMDAYHHADPKQPITYTCPFIRKDGNVIWLEVTARLIFTPEGDVQEIVAIARDVTERYREQENLIAQHQADQATLRRNIVTTLPHELRTPLSAIIGFTSVLEHDWRNVPPTEVDELLRQVNAAGGRMETLIDKYTLYAYLIMAEPETVDAPMLGTSKHEVRAQVHMAALRQARRAERETDLVLDLNASVPTIALPYLSRITDELVSNALKFSEAGTPVTVTSTSNGDRYTLTICDHGRGFPEGALDKIGAFMQFERDQYEQQGAGLGLAIIKQLLRLYGGAWVLESSAKQTKVSVSFPLAWSHAIPSTEPAHQLQAS
ncbi:MAG: hypothetical protein RhofKO_23110 [Rhodothermales bacterium]